MTDSGESMGRVEPFGDRAVLVTCRDRDDRDRLAGLLSAAFPALTVRHGITTVLVEARHPTASLIDAVTDVVTHASPEPQAGASSAVLVELVVQYDGTDLADVAAALSCSVADLIRAHCEQRWRVDLMGFAPGFGYLVPLGTALLDWSRVSRRSSPRASVPQGAVAIAAGMSAVYPATMPGGWHLIGRTESVMFDARRQPSPALLTPYSVVRFVAASA